MHPIQTICVGVKLPSKHSAEALESAANLARGLGAPVVAVHVVEPVHLYQRILSPVQSSLISTEELASRAADELQKICSSNLFDGLRSDYRIEVGNPSSGLIASANSCNAEILVIGAQRRSEIEQLLLGGTAERVLRKASCSVLVAKTVLSAKPRCLLAPTDFSDSSRPALERAVEFARRWQARLIFVHVIEPVAQANIWPAEPVPVELFLAEPQDLAPEWRAVTDQLPLSQIEWTSQTRKGEAAAEIVACARENSAELIIMGTHGRTGLLHALLGSVAERLARLSETPVMTVRPNAFEFPMP
jgi:nucleotide-binding universal stress UspA family protein